MGSLEVEGHDLKVSAQDKSYNTSGNVTESFPVLLG